MAGDLIRAVRRGALAHLKHDGPSIALVPAERMYPSTTPPKRPMPFSRMDTFQSTTLDASCLAGATVTFLLHGFSNPLYVENDPKKGVLDEAEDRAGLIASAFKVALHNKRVPIDGGWFARLRVRSVRLMRDGDEETAYHAILSVEARVLAA